MAKIVHRWKNLRFVQEVFNVSLPEIMCNYAPVAAGQKLVSAFWCTNGYAGIRNLHGRKSGEAEEDVLDEALTIGFFLFILYKTVYMDMSQEVLIDG
ncbi:hypothetical protein [Alteribacter natronophilus]|uniref:hypothetical protein n=1 Tax=Alteribacter natronophilus TaxID=2583810 RepID=UPI00110D6CFB|nr:hypothetical protein [Alteribacter natronophilus]TMW72000.1 hypothetical protein FGB90_07180 [Alteribacter natronophilus]